MPKLNKNDAPDSMQLEGYEGHFGELGDYTVGFETYTADADLADLFRGLPDDRCQCPHWGVVLKGKLMFTGDDGDTISQRRRGLLRRTRTPATPLCRHRGDRVQPDPRTARNTGRGRKEHGRPIRLTRT